MKKTYKVFHEKYSGEDFTVIDAYDASDAAEIYAEEYDCDEPTIASGRPIEVKVESPDGVITTYSVHGEFHASYYAYASKVDNEN